MVIPSLNNYQPISVLPTLGKVLKRLIYNQCIDYIIGNNLLTVSQAGFREGHSTGACLANFLNEIYEEVDNGGTCGVLFLDLAKAFDTVDHLILVDKLKLLGFKASAQSWFSSYLDNRSQSTKFGNSISANKSISCGVLQGSILGPFLFLCYINDLPQGLKHTQGFLYADDTALLVRGKDPMELELNLNAELTSVARWFDANKLSMNTSKTKLMHFRHTHNIRSNRDLNVMINGELIESVSQFKYLGVTLDTHLSLDSHIDKVCGKVNSRTGLLRRVRNFVSKDLATHLYKSLVDPHFWYCNYIHSGCSLTNRRKLQIAQNNSLRAIAQVDNLYPTEALHIDLEIDWLDVTVDKTLCIEMFKNVHGLNPIRNYQKVNWLSHDRALRSNTHAELAIRRTNTKLGDQNMFCRGPRAWLHLPEEIRKLETLSGLRTAVKKHDGFPHTR